MLVTQRNDLFLHKFCAGLRLESGNMVLSYDYNRSTRALIRISGAYNVTLEYVSEETDYKWAPMLETSIPLDKELSIQLAQLKPRKLEDDE